jgi:outer membrane receptor protein involved in Fe transport
MNTRTILLCSAGVSLLTAMPAYGQDSRQPADEQRPDTIVITAQKREETLIEVPMTVQAVSEEQLEAAGVKDVGALTRLIPGASVVSSSSRGFETIQIRGISAGTTGDGLTGYYVDDFAFGVPNLQLSPPARLLDLERVEIIRGPSGTLWGQGSMGGNIRLITADPDTSAFSGKLLGEYSTTEGGGDNYAVDGVLNIPVVPDVFAIRVSGGYDELGGYANVLQSGQENANDSSGSNFRVKALYTPDDRLAVRASYWSIQNEQGFNNGLIRANPQTAALLPEPAINGGGSVTNGPVDGFTDTSLDIGSLSITYDFDFATLTSATSASEHELDFEAPLSLAGFNYNHDSTFKTDTFTQELRLTSSDDGPLRWLAGAYYRDATIDSDINFYADGTDFLLGLIPVINSAGDLQTTSWSVYAETSYELFDGKLVPLIGLRYFEDERTGGPSLNRITNVTTPQQTVSFDKLSPRFNLKYRPDDNTTLFLNIANGFRSGSVQTAAQVAAAATLGVPTSAGIDPDELWTYEVGAKLALLDDDLLLEGSAYQTEWADVQLPFGPLSSVANVGDATIRGVDIGAIWLTPIDGLTLQANANLQDTEWDSVRGAITASLPYVAPGRNLIDVPDSTLSLGASYEQPVDLLGQSTLKLSGNYAFRNATLANTGGETDSLSNLSLTADLVTGEGWTLGVFGHNLTDEDGAAQLTLGGGFVRPYPRRIGVKIGKDF